MSKTSIFQYHRQKKLWGMFNLRWIATHLKVETPVWHLDLVCYQVFWTLRMSLACKQYSWTTRTVTYTSKPYKKQRTHMTHVPKGRKSRLSRRDATKMVLLFLQSRIYLKTMKIIILRGKLSDLNQLCSVTEVQFNLLTVEKTLIMIWCSWCRMAPS